MDSFIILKACDVSRQDRCVIPALPNIKSLLEQGSIVFKKPLVNIVLECDGCRITSDLALCAFQSSLLMLLGVDELWTPNNLHVAAHNPDTEDGTSNEEYQISSEVNQELYYEEVIGQEQVVNVEQNNNQDHVDQKQVIVTLTSSSAKMMDLVAADTEENVMQLPDDTELQQLDVLEKDAAADDSLLVECQPSSSKAIELQNHVTNKPPTTSIVCDENTSPNVGEKRPHQDEIRVTKSSKKHASTEMKFNAFRINWSKISENLITRLDALQTFKLANSDVAVPSKLRFSKRNMSLLLNLVVDQLRNIDTAVSSSTLESVSNQILKKYPCLEPCDDDGFQSGKGSEATRIKMVHRNSYLNRFKEPEKEPSNAIDGRKSRNVRAGTVKQYWTKTSKDCTKETVSKLLRDEPELLSHEFLEESQAYVRYRLDSMQDLRKIVTDLPVLRRRQMLRYHFEKATGVDGESLRKYFTAKKAKIVDFSKTFKKIQRLSNTSSTYDVLNFLATAVGEILNDLIFKKEIGTRIDDIYTDVSGPLLVAIDTSNEKQMFYVYAEQTRLSEGTPDLLDGLAELMYIHYVHNFMYMKCISKFLELIQEYFFKIIPLVGSKSKATRVGQRQRIVRKIIVALSEHDMASESPNEIHEQMDEQGEKN